MTEGFFVDEIALSAFVSQVLLLPTWCLPIGIGLPVAKLQHIVIFCLSVG